MRLNLSRYSECKPRLALLLLWRVVECVLFFSPSVIRIALLRLFGAKIGKHCLVCRGAKFHAPWNFKCGDFVCIGPKVEIYCKDKIEIGSEVIVSQGAYLCTASHDVTSSLMDLITQPIEIEDCVWVAAKAIILPGVVLHEGAVIGCGAVVAKDVAAWTVVGGNPAKFIKKRALADETNA